jgi:hypothetical protein
MNNKLKLAVVAVASFTALAGLAHAQTLTTTLKPPALKPVVNSTVITAVTATGKCGDKLYVSVTLKGGTFGGDGTIVVGTSGRFSAPYKVGASAVLTVTIPTTNAVTCGTTGASIPSGSTWLEPTTGGSDAMMWVLRPATVTYSAAKEPIPG